MISLSLLSFGSIHTFILELPFCPNLLQFCINIIIIYQCIFSLLSRLLIRDVNNHKDAQISLFS